MLFGIKSGILCQQVNCQNKMGAGLAKAIMEQYPAVAREYHKAFLQYSKEELFGKVQIVPVEKSLYVANLFTQFDYGNPKKSGKIYTDEDKLIEAICKVLRAAKNFQPKDTAGRFPVFVPYEIGCGYGGGNWNSIWNRLTHLSNLAEDDKNRLVIYDTMYKKYIYRADRDNERGGEYELC